MAVESTVLPSELCSSSAYHYYRVVVVVRTLSGHMGAGKLPCYVLYLVCDPSERIQLDTLSVLRAVLNRHDRVPLLGVLGREALHQTATMCGLESQMNSHCTTTT